MDELKYASRDPFTNLHRLEQSMVVGGLRCCFADSRCFGLRLRLDSHWHLGSRSHLDWRYLDCSVGLGWPFGLGRPQEASVVQGRSLVGLRHRRRA